MNRRAGQRIADLVVYLYASLAIIAGYPDLDQLVGGEATVDFLKYGFGQAVIANQDNRAKWMGCSAKRTALAGSDF